MGPDEPEDYDVNIIAEYLDINPKHVAHLVLPDYTEVIGEVVIDDESDTLVDAILLVYPIKLQKITSINKDMIEESNALVKWSSINKDPWTYIGKKAVISFNPVTNEEMLDLYLDAVLHAYYDPDLFYGSDEEDIEQLALNFESSNKKKPFTGNNIIQFPKQNT